MSQAFIIDFIHESPVEYSGAEKNWDREDDGRKPVIDTLDFTLRSAMSPFSNEKVFPYPLDDKKNIKKVTGIGKVDVYVLIPTQDIPNYSSRDYERSFYNQYLSDENTAEMQELIDENERLQNRVETLNRELDKVSQEDDEDNSSGSTGPKMHECNYCGNSFRKSKWKDSDENGEDMCPNCAQGTFENAKEVN